jgi:hypothetical protein
MFISKKEKEQLQNTFELFKTQIKNVKEEISEQRDLILHHRSVFTTLINQIEALKNPPLVGKKPRKKRTMSPEGRAKMSQIMKDRHAKAKLEKQNANSINTTSI